MVGILDFIKRPRFDHPDRKAALANRSQVYNLLDNIIGFEDDRVTPGEALGAQARTDPIGLLGSVVQGVGGDLRNLMFEGGARQRPQDVLGYAAAPMAPGAMSGRVANVLSSGGAKPKSITAYHGGTGSVADAAGGRGAWFSEAKDLADEYAFGGGSVNQFSISPQRPIEFLHAEQRRPIGDLISTAVENAGDLSDKTISAARGKISALQNRYGDEKRPLFEYWNNDPDIADLFRTLGYDSISVAEKSGGPQTWAALTPDIISPSTPPARALNPAEQMAKDILDLRSAGRAGDVTEEMMAQADPQYMFANTPLPMDEASRMARAGEIDAYHGTDRTFSAFDSRRFGEKDPGWYGRGVTTDTDPEVAAGYANYDEAEIGQQIIPVRLSGGRYMEWPEGQLPFGNPRESIAGTRDMQALGYSGSRMTNDRDLYGDAPDVQSEYVTFDPSNVRSRFARFDPEFRHLRNLSAGVGGLGLLSTMLPQEEQY